MYVLYVYQRTTYNVIYIMLYISYRYSFGYPIGHTAVLGAFSKIQVGALYSCICIHSYMYGHIQSTCSNMYYYMYTYICYTHIYVYVCIAYVHDIRIG